MRSLPGKLAIFKEICLLQLKWYITNSADKTLKYYHIGLAILRESGGPWFPPVPPFPHTHSHTYIHTHTHTRTHTLTHTHTHTHTHRHTPRKQKRKRKKRLKFKKFSCRPTMVAPGVHWSFQFQIHFAGPPIWHDSISCACCLNQWNLN